MHALLLPFLFSVCAAGSSPITVESLLEEMTDLERLTRPADYTTRQFSSFDRASLHGDWFANNDCGNYLRQEHDERGGDQWVLAEADGPGAIVRIWSANPAGVLRITLDGAVALEEDFAKLLSGAVAPFASPLGATRSRGFDLYFPIPYAKRMKVTCSKGGQYYHVDYRTYPRDTPVETFDRAKLPQGAIDRAREALRSPAQAKATSRVPLVAAHEPTIIGAEIAGPKTIVALELEVTQGAQDPRLRECTIRATFDGELCVNCPLIDFFGTAPTCVSFETLPFSAKAEGMLVCRFPMPFERSGQIELQAVEGISIKGTAVVRDGACGPLHFHAWWHGSNAVKTRPFSDWSVLHGRGRGRYVGTTLSVRNPVTAWWGEGDEKVRVDGEDFPSIFGTGTEDYFGYAWSSPDLFTAPYHSQSRCDGPGTKGQTAVNRFHVLDDIPFSKEIHFDLEVWHWADTEIGYATTAYWYAEPGFSGETLATPWRMEDRRVLPVPPPKHVPGALEGEALEVLSVTGGVAEKQDMAAFGDGWSGDAHLWWRSAEPGAVLRLGFASPFAGRGRIHLAMTKAPDYGIAKVSLNGNALATIDLYDKAVVPTGERPFVGSFVAGRNELTIEIVGSNPAANPKNYMFGLDYIRVEEAW
jgi:hypothetical protein